MGFIRLLSFYGLLLVLMMTGCSPLGFFGAPEDKTLQSPTGSREIPEDCKRLDLSSAHLNPTNFRQVLACVNKTGALTPLLQWVDSTPREDLAVILQALDRAFLKNPERRKAWTRATVELSELGLLRESFDRIAQDPHFVERWVSRVSVVRELVGESEEDLHWLKALLSAVLGRWSDENFENDRDALIAVLEAPATRSLQERLSAGRSAEIFGELLSVDRKNSAQEPRSDWISVLLRMAADGGLSRTFRSPHLLGADPEAWSLKVPALVQFQNELFSNQAALFKAFADLYRIFSTTQTCWKNSQEIREGPKKITLELLDHVGRSNARRFVQRDTVLSTVWLNGLCEFPAALYAQYPSAVKFADSPSFGTSWDVLRSIQESGHLDALLDFLTSPKTQSTADLFSQMSALDLFGDSILMLLLPRDQEPSEKAIDQHWASILSDEKIYPGLQKALAKVSGATWARWLRAPLGEDAWIRTLRRAYYSGSRDQHPYFDILKDWMRELSKDPHVLRIWLKHTQKKEFQSALEWLQRASGSGQAQDLLVFFSQVFGDSVDRAFGGRPTRKDPPMRILRSHDLSARDLSPYVPQRESEPHPVSQACQKLDLSFHLGAIERRDFDLQLSYYLACVDTDQMYSRFADGVRALRKISVESGTLYSLGLQQVRKFNARVTPSQALELSELFIPALGSGEVGDWIKILARALGDQPESGIAAPLLELAPDLQELAPQLSVIQSAAARVLSNDEFPVLALGVQQVWGALDRALPTLPKRPLPIPRSVIARELWKTECDLPAPQLKKRVDELIAEHENTVTNFDTLDGKPRTTWRKGELESHVLPLLRRFSDPVQNKSKVTLMQSLLALLRSFSLEPGEARSLQKRYTPQEMRDWVLSKSQDLRVIPYFYPDDVKPRARLISVLDALEMILINSDITDFRGEHYGVRVLMMFAESWGDEPRALWPAEIQAKYPARGSKRPPKLSDTLNEVEKLLGWISRVVGDPRLPHCLRDAQALPSMESVEELSLGTKIEGYRKGLFNNRYIIPIIRETMPDSAGPHRGGFRILRDLFWALHISTPEEFRSSKSGERNNMQALLNLVRAGLLRQVSRFAVRVPIEDTRVEAATESLLGIALAPELESAIRKIFEDPLLRGFTEAWTRKLISLVHAGDERSERLAALGTYGVLAISKLKLDGESLPVEWPRALGRALSASFAELAPGFFPDPRWLDDLVATDIAAQALVALYENNNPKIWSAWTRLTQAELSRKELFASLAQVANQLNADPSARQSMLKLESRMRSFLRDPALARLDWRQKIDSVLRYFADETQSRARSAWLLRNTLADLLAPGSDAFPQQCIAAAAGHRDEIYDLLGGLSEIASSGELELMLSRAWRNLTPASAR